MEILKYKKRRWIWPGLFLLLCICSSAWATGADVTITSVKRFNGITPVTNSFVSLQYGSSTVHNAAWDFGTSTFGYGPGTGNGIAVLATAWDSSTSTVAPDASKHYGYLSGTTSGMGELPATISGSIIAKYRAFKPFDPEIYRIVESKITDYPAGSVSGDLTIKARQQLPGTGEDAEVSAYLWRYWRESDTATETTTTGDLVIRGATGPATYHFQVALDNQWGEPTAYSPVRNYEFGGPGGPGGAVSVTYNLKKAEGGLGLNAIAALHAIPFRVESTTGINTVGKLITAINTKSGTNNVTTFGWMEDGNANLQGWYITYDASGTATYTPTAGLTTGADTPLAANRIYQISVLQNVDVTFTSE